ncbi:MAG: ATP-dependent helicase [Candidatus Sericytochromatia bacterium]|nr:ATP-dependent helicase [Candidatus Sericytochromatia bacterium]
MTTGAVTLRPAQAAILTYSGGQLAISAAPGAGKTFILEQLAVRLVEDLGVRPAEILILTYMRSAALNLKQRLTRTLAARGLTAFGLQTTTIHGFASSVIRRAAGDSDSGMLVWSEAERRKNLQEALLEWLEDPLHQQMWQAYGQRDGGGDEREDPQAVVLRLAEKAIAEAKQARLSEADFQVAVVDHHPALPALYRGYLARQQAAGAYDYDDLIREANAILATRDDHRAYHQRRIRFVLEDEAQDSTPDQQALIRWLTEPALGGSGNLVRVGDTNQAIMASFTHNSPRYFRAFCQACETSGRHMPMAESSRSALPVLAMANALVAFTAHHPDPVVREAFTGQPILPATAGKPNPSLLAPITWTFYEGARRDDAAAQEELGVLTAVRAFLRAHPTARAAVLVTSHKLRMAYAQRATQLGIPLQQGVSQGPSQRQCLRFLAHVLTFLSLPLEEPAASWRPLVEEWAQLCRTPWQNPRALRQFLARHPSDSLLFPLADLPPHRPEDFPAADYLALLSLCRGLRALLRVRHLPPGELFPSVALTLIDDPQAIAVAAKAAVIAQRKAASDPTIELDPLRRLADEVRTLAENTEDHRDLVPTPADTREATPGTLSVLTLHASKGLEYDAVWIPGLASAYMFPWDPDQVSFRDQAAFCLEQALRAPPGAPFDLAAARAAAQRLLVAEKLRLLYVGMTRAERALHLSGAGTSETLPPQVAQLASLCERVTP